MQLITLWYTLERDDTKPMRWCQVCNQDNFGNTSLHDSMSWYEFVHAGILTSSWGYITWEHWSDTLEFITRTVELWNRRIRLSCYYNRVTNTCPLYTHVTLLCNALVIVSYPGVSGLCSAIISNILSCLYMHFPLYFEIQQSV